MDIRKNFSPLRYKKQENKHFHNEIFIKVNAKTKDEDFPLNKDHHQDNLTKFVFDPEIITISNLQKPQK